MAQIGFIGLGHMGQPMVCNLIKTGHQVLVFDLNEVAMQSAITLGAKAASSVAELSAASDVIFTMVQTGEQVSQLCLGEHGIFANAKPNSLYIDSSSIDVETSRELHLQAQENEIDMLDAPVSGGVKGAETASLAIMVGGDEAVFERAKPYLNCLGKNIVHAGAAGNGQVAKICNNMILAISMIGISESFNLAEKLGLPAKKLFEISSKASGQCWAMTSYSPVPDCVDNVPSNNDYKPGFTAQMMLKDLNLSQAAANTAELKTGLGAQATKIYQEFVESGHGDVDFSGIIEMLKLKTER